MTALVQHSARENLPAKQENSSAIEESKSKLLPDEALDIVSDLYEQFPNCKAEDGFTQLLAKVLLRFPRRVSESIINSVDGLALQQQFLNVANAAAWLEAKAAPLYKDADRELWIERQQNQPAWLTAQATPSVLDKADKWLKRVDPKVRELGGNSDERITAEHEDAKQKSEEHIARETKSRLAEYAAAGVDPVYADKSGLLLSLPLLLSLGWSIREGEHGEKMMVRPGH